MAAMEHMCSSTTARNVSVIVLGNSHVGKTSLILRYTEDRFMPTFYSTLGIDFKMKTIDSGANKIKLQIWDTGGQERFRTMTRNYYEKAMGVVLVYDCTDAKSFHEVHNWLKQIENHVKHQVVTILVAAKKDRSDIAVNPALGRELAADYKIEFFETSAKTGENINKPFEYIAEEICRRNYDTQSLSSSFNLVVAPSKPAKKKSCC